MLNRVFAIVCVVRIGSWRACITTITTKRAPQSLRRTPKRPKRRQPLLELGPNNNTNNTRGLACARRPKRRQPYFSCRPNDARATFSESTGDLVPGTVRKTILNARAASPVGRSVPGRLDSGARGQHSRVLDACVVSVVVWTQSKYRMSSFGRVAQGSRHACCCC